MGKGIFITGTGTGVGKTIISAGLALALKERGMKVGVMKPIATGCIGENGTLISTDAVYLFEAAENEYAPLTSPYRFRNPVSPNVAQIYEQKEIDTDAILAAYKKLTTLYDFVIVEGIGGLMVPIKKKYFVANLIREMDLPVIVVSNIGLGAINHTLLTVDSAMIRGLQIRGIIFNRAPFVNFSLAELTNPKVINELTGLPILGTLPELDDVNVDQFRYGRLLEIFKDRINIDQILK